MNTKYIKSPYNFVPVNNTVVFPYWADLISHDIPFEDAHSGTLTIKLKAHSSIFVRNGAPKKPKEDQEKQHESDFSQANGQYFIPGSSLKGMVRNVLEVMTFSKMGNKVDDHRYAIRDLSPAAKEIYRDHFNTGNTFAGWLFKDGNGDYKIIDCDIPGRISHESIDSYFGTGFSTFFGEQGDFDSKNDVHKSSKFKYEMFEPNKKEQHFSHIKKDNPGREIYEVSLEENIGKKGKLVFTGQPDKRKPRKDGTGYDGKYYEFIFLDSKKEKNVSQTVVEDFFFAYFNHDPKRQSDDWKYWMAELKKGNRIPVFFHKDGIEVSTIGLSYLFKLPYANSVTEAIPAEHKTGTVDFSEALFGFIKGDKYEESLKGRVHFGHAFAISDTTFPDTEASEVLSSPKASYYPNYIRQTNIRNGKVERYNTFMDPSAQIAGWKRYPVHRNGVKHNPIPSSASEDVLVKFTPLKSGAEFEFKVRYHNLRKVELGALISALTFHNTPNTFHSLGMAKPLGYGKVSLHVEELKNEREYLRAFEAYMESEVDNWLVCAQITELLTMASDQQSDSSLAYMQLELRNNNEFTEAKKAKEALDVYSKLGGVQRKIANSFLHPGDIEKIQDEKTRFKNIQAKLVDKRAFLKTQEQYFQKALAQKKEDLIQALRKRKAEIEKQVRESEKSNSAEIAKSTTPNWDKIPLDRRNAFDELSKVIKLYVQKLNNGIAYEKILKQRDSALLPEHLHKELIDKIQQIFNQSSKSEKESWIKPYEKNARLKKVAEWIGEAARDIDF